MIVSDPVVCRDGSTLEPPERLKKKVTSRSPLRTIKSESQLNLGVKAWVCFKSSLEGHGGGSVS